MPTLITRLGGVNFTAPGLPVLKSLTKGFVSEGLVSLYRFNDAATGALKNEAPGGADTGVATVGAAGDSATLLAGGGIRLKGTAHVPNGVNTDLSLPFTVMMHATFVVPAPNVYQGLIGTVAYPQRGFSWYAQADANPPAATYLSNIFRPSKNGAQGSNSQVAGATAFNYGNPRTLALTWDGASFRVSVWNSGALVKDKIVAVPLAEIATNSSGQVSNLVRIAFGSTSTLFPGVDMILDVGALYNRVLTDTEIVSNDYAGISLRVSRPAR